jgi:hypothetical protein
MGATLERMYVQETPMGTITIAYMESERAFAENARLFASSDLQIDSRYVELVEEVHGVDLRRPRDGGPPETVGAWTDPKVTTRRKGLAFIAPLLPGKLDEGRAFAREAFEKRVAELTASRRALAENVEVISLVPNPTGDFCCVYLEGTDPVESNRRFAGSTRPYDVWFRDRLKQLFPPGVEFDRPLPPIFEVFDSAALPITA